jgi:hypothetical protein
VTAAMASLRWCAGRAERRQQQKGRPPRRSGLTFTDRYRPYDQRKRAIRPQKAEMTWLRSLRVSVLITADWP